MEVTENISVRYAAGVAYLTLNRPQARNAMSLAMVDELIDKLQQTEKQGDSRIVVVRGAGGNFCAGADLKDMASARARVQSGQMDATEGDPVANINRRFGELCATFSESPLATITVLEGAVMGGGFGLACASDITLADATANLRLPETALGLVPAQIAPYLVERLGYSQAKRLAVTGGSVDAAAAARLGLVHELFSDTATLDVGLSRVIGEILACAPQALAASKKLVARARLETPRALIEESALAFSQAAMGPEGMEGIRAFIEKRKPSWAPQ
ncbi:MAG: enoyl-CoA hydratase/isomerase family protein [Rhodoferax sp.]|nr:enoyl-CoA hydratase/isomerase family protein [Rhodoferax sp.]